MAEYIWAKQNLYRYQKPGDVLVLNGDNSITKDFVGIGETRYFSRQKTLDKGVYLKENIIFRDETPVLDTQTILLPGVHNVENYMAAIGALQGIASDDAIRYVAANFGGVEHRIELVRIVDGVKYYNDSIASSPSRTIAGLRSFSQKVLLIAGGYDKHIPYDVLGPEVCEKVKILLVNGATGPQIRQAVEQTPGYTPGNPEIVDCADFTDAVNRSVQLAKAGDIVLMSPASAAFDQFKNFMERGNYFKKLIKEL